jgi:multidrug efflux pump subunit AcrA (membrane-fusion protein)
MKRRVAIIAVVVVLIAGAAGAGWLYFRLNPTAWDAFLAEMQGGPSARVQTSSAAPRPVKRPARASARLVASGTVEVQEVNVAAEMGGRIVEILTDEGKEVAAGDLLVRLDQAVLLAQRDQAASAVAQAQAALDAAQAQLDLARAGARPQEIAAAEGRVDEAQAGLDAASGQLAAAEAEWETAQAQLQAAQVAQANAEALAKAAQAELDGAKAQLSAAQTRVEQIKANLAQARVQDLEPERTAAEVGLERARIALDDVQDEYNKALDRPWEDQSIRDTWAKRLTQAQLDYRLAEAQLDQVQQAQRARAFQLAALAAQVQEAQAQLSPAGVNGAQARLDQAEAGVQAAKIQLLQAESGVKAARAARTIAQAGVQAAQARLDQAQAALDLLKAGARDQELSLLEANVAQAEALLDNAQAALQVLDAQLARQELRAPVGGIVLERTVHAGELAAPSAPLLTIANLDEVTLTVYVPEADLGQVSLGQPVEVTVDAYSDVFSGTVSYIASQAEFTPKNVQTQEERVHMVFAVKITLENADHRLKPGMPADAAFQ